MRGQGPRGQGFLGRKLRPSFDSKLRARTASALWGGAILFFAIEYFGGIGVTNADSDTWYWTLTPPAVVAAIVPFYMARKSHRAHLVADHISLSLAWVNSALVIYSSGGATSPYNLVFLPTLLYCAFFLPTRRQIAVQATAGSLAALAPLAYDSGTAVDSGFLPLIFCSTVVYVSATGLVAYRRRQLRAAELEARRMALTDPLTEAANLRTFRLFGQELVASGRSFAVVMVDLDGLRATNIVFGHAGGDEIICRAARMLHQASRPEDQVARLGGDEFAVLLPDCGQVEAIQWSTRFGEALSRQDAEARGPRDHVSASWGYAVFGEDGTALDDLMATADQRMFEQKKARRRAVRQLTDRSSARMTRPPARTEPERGKFDFNRPSRLPDVIGWSLGVSIFAVLWALPGYDSDAVAGSLILATTALAMAGLVLTGPRGRRIAGLCAALSPLPVLLLTGGADSPAIVLPLLVVAYYASFWGDRIAIPHVAVTLVSFVAAFPLAGAATQNDRTRFSSAVFYAVMIHLVLRYNSRRIEAAEARVRGLSLIDPLTGIANRRVFERELMRLRQESGSEDGPWPFVALLNLDDFKQVNSDLGHRGGDELLRQVARVLTATVEGHGTVCRIGGDEFAVAGVSSDPLGIGDLAQSCHDAVAGIGKTTAQRALSGRETSVSVGYAIGRPWVSVTMLVSEADAAMQLGKESGRGTVTTTSPAGSDETRHDALSGI